MFASSTPVISKRKRSSLSSPGVSPIYRKVVVPKLPKGITVQIRRVPLSNKSVNREIGCPYRASSTYEKKIPPTFPNTIKPQASAAAHPLSSQRKDDVRGARKPSRGPLVGSVKANVTLFPELIVISDSEEDHEIIETIGIKPLLSQSVKRRRISTAVKIEASDIPLSHDAFLQKQPHYSDHKALSAEHHSQRFGSRKGGNEVARKRSRTTENEERGVATFLSLANGRLPQTEISKFSLSGVEAWKEVKDQPGAFFSKGMQPHTSDTDGGAFPAKTGYLKMSVKTKMEIPSCGTNVVFTVIKGKGYIKNKSNGTDEKTEMNVGDTFVAPRGSNFCLINQATKNEFFLSYVKVT